MVCTSWRPKTERPLTPNKHWGPKPKRPSALCTAPAASSTRERQSAASHHHARAAAPARGAQPAGGWLQLQTPDPDPSGHHSNTPVAACRATRDTPSTPTEIRPIRPRPAGGAAQQRGGVLASRLLRCFVLQCDSRRDAHFRTTPRTSPAALAPDSPRCC